jgi:hypothetical protein
MPVVKFNELQGFEHLSRVWGVAVEDLTTINNSADQSGWYSEMQIPKRGKANRGKFRTVYKVEWGILKQLQKNISRDINETNLFPDCVKGFVRGRSAVDNAKAHVDQRVILNADIKDFFDSITTEQVLGAFIRLGCKKDIATLLTKICTFNGRLPQGASTSPVVSNLVCSGLDSDLAAFASRQGARYTRYADDLTFSTSGTSNAKESRRQNAHPEAWKEPICDRPLRCGSKRASGASSGEATAAPRALLCEEIRNPEPLVPSQPRMDRTAPARLFSRMDRLPLFRARRESTGAAASQAARIPLDRLRLGAVTIDPRPNPAARGGDANSGRPTAGPAGS